MVGIYKITNNANGHSYVGQSRNIEKRWRDEKCAANNPNQDAYNYPLSKAFRKYGVENFTFEVIEECKIEELNEKENYWINYYHCEYNQTIGDNYQVHGTKLTIEQVKEIQNILLADTAGEVINIDLAKKYNVSVDTIRAINNGKQWFNEQLTYPLRVSKFSAMRGENKIKNKCVDCGIEIFKTSTRCTSCYNKYRIKCGEKTRPVTREELKKLIREMPFTQIGLKYGVSDNSVKKWCDAYNLPRKKKDIKAYSDSEWELV